MGTYIDRDDLRIALGPQKYVAYFDDDKDGVVEPEAVDQVILRAEARLNRYAREVTSFTLDGIMPEGFKAMAIEYSIVIAEARVSAVSRDDAERRLEALDQDMKDVAKGLTTIADTQANPRVGEPPDPATPPGGLAAGFVDFTGTGVGECVGTDWFRKEGCR